MGVEGRWGYTGVWLVYGHTKGVYEVWRVVLKKMETILLCPSIEGSKHPTFC